MARLSEQLTYCPRCAGALQARPAGDAGLLHPVCTICGLVLWQNRKLCVDALITRGEGLGTEVLLGRTISTGEWDLPGNFLNAEDYIEPAVIRECRREMDVDVQVGEVLGAYEDVFETTPTVDLVYLCTLTGGDPRAAHLIDRVAWFPLPCTVDNLSRIATRALSDLQARLGKMP